MFSLELKLNNSSLALNKKPLASRLSKGDHSSQISPRNSQYIPQISPKYSPDIPQISTLNVVKSGKRIIYPRFPTDIPHISIRYPTDIVKIFPRYPTDIVKLARYIWSSLTFLASLLGKVSCPGLPTPTSAPAVEENSKLPNHRKKF